MEQHEGGTSIAPRYGAVVASSHLGAVALLVFLTVEMLMSQLFLAGEWWGIRSVALSLLLALVPSTLLTILFLVGVNWLVDRRPGDRTTSQRTPERAAQPYAGEHVFYYDEGGPASSDTARSTE